MYIGSLGIACSAAAPVESEPLQLFQDVVGVVLRIPPILYGSLYGILKQLRAKVLILKFCAPHFLILTLFI
jgi:hypothetical protein